jgi:hypothetical protein
MKLSALQHVSNSAELSMVIPKRQPVCAATSFGERDAE